MKKFICILLSLVLALSLAACGGGEEPAPEEAPAPSEDVEPAPGDAEAGQSDWAVYWYLCGSDLETNGGCATTDIYEMMEVQLPENVTVVIETGGAAAWQNDFVDASLLQRYVYNSEGLSLVDEQPSANMGDPETLSDFLTYARDNYPADRTAVVFWNHGGGSVTGAAFDELYGSDSLSLSEMYSAFAGVWEPNTEEQPLELVGFDTCLMATVDTAYTFCDLAKYLVASEETEPGNGWYYTGWLGALAENSGMNGAELGADICDSFYEGCQMVGTESSTTLSVTDLSQIGPLVEAYESFGAEGMSVACESPAFFSEFSRAAISAENYGGNTDEQGYTNMVDLGHLARQSMDIMPETAQSVLDALEGCIVYKINGEYRTEATGLSCYYSYNGDMDDFNGFLSVGAAQSFKYLYSYGLTGELGEDGMGYIESLGFDALPELLSVTAMGWDGLVPELGDDGTYTLALGPEADDVLASIGFSLYYSNPESGALLLLGTDNDMDADWENGVFRDNFRGVWGSLGGCLVYMELSYEGDDYNLYSVPVLINGEQLNLQVVYDFSVEEWSILGARQAIDESGMADKDLYILQDGDEITTIHYASNGEGFEPVPMDTMSYSADVVFGETQLPDADYIMVFEMRDALGGLAKSDSVMFTVDGGEIFAVQGN